MRPPSDGWGGALAATVDEALHGATLTPTGTTPAIVGVRRPFDATLREPGQFMVRPAGITESPSDGLTYAHTGALYLYLEQCELVLCVSDDQGRTPRLPIWPAVARARRAIEDKGWRDAPQPVAVEVEWTRESERDVAIVAKMTIGGWTGHGTELPP